MRKMGGERRSGTVGTKIEEGKERKNEGKGIEERNSLGLGLALSKILRYMPLVFVCSGFHFCITLLEP